MEHIWGVNMTDLPEGWESFATQKTYNTEYGWHWQILGTMTNGTDYGGERVVIGLLIGEGRDADKSHRGRLEWFNLRITP